MKVPLNLYLNLSCTLTWTLTCTLYCTLTCTLSCTLSCTLACTLTCTLSCNLTCRKRNLSKKYHSKIDAPERNLPYYHCHSYMTIFKTRKGWMLPCDFYFSSMQISIRYVFKVGQKISLAPLYTHYPH